MNKTISDLQSRRSCKGYQNKHVPKDVIEQIVACGLNAPSGRNLQAPIFVVVSNESVVAELSKLNAQVMGVESDPFYGAKDVIVVLSSKEANTYVYDGAVALCNLQNAAYALGVDSCWIHRAKQVFEGERGKQLVAEWGITKEVEGIGFCVLGYANKQPAEKQIKPNRVYYVD